MQTIGKLKDISIDFESNKPKITLILNDQECLNSLEKIKDDKLVVEIKKWYKKRSIDANAYCWILCDKIAKELCNDDCIVSKEEVYKDAILQIGTFEPFIVQEKGFEKFKRIWEKQGLGFIVQEVSKKDKCVRVNCYYGSSTYNSKEMSLLIQILIDLAKSLNIETKPENELKNLLESWG